MAYEYIAISDHPDDVISLSVGHQAELHAHIHYKGLLKQGLSPSPSGVLSSKDSIAEDNIEEGEHIDELGCSSSSGTIPANNISTAESKLTEDSSHTGVPKDQQVNQRRRSREAIRRRRYLYKLRRQQKLHQPKEKCSHKKEYPQKTQQKQPFKYHELQITVKYND